MKLRRDARAVRWSAAALWVGALSLVPACSGQSRGDGPAPLEGGADGATGHGDAGDVGSANADAGTAVSIDAEGGAGVSCTPGTSGLRRLSHFEYDNTIRDLLGQGGTAAALVPESSGNGFANDADGRDVSLPLAEGYRRAALRVAEAATESTAALATLAPCAATATAASSPACARTLVESFGARAFRRPLQSEEVDGLLALHAGLLAAGADFPAALAGVIQAVLQSPEFLYRVEWGVGDAAVASRRRPSGSEMATRLSYLFWGSTPDDALRAAASSGELLTAAGVRAQATRLLADARAHEVVRYFFDQLFRLGALTELTRDPLTYPTFSTDVARAMREETGVSVASAVFQENASFPQLLTLPYTFVDETLARFYGIPGVMGSTFVKVTQDPTQRLGLLTQGGVMAAGVANTAASAASRGTFVANRLLCRTIAKPHPDLAGSTAGATARDRLSAATAPAMCSSCHATLNPLGFALEHYDAIGRYRDDDNGVAIDAQVEVPGIPGAINGGVELARTLAALPEAQECFADQWLAFAQGLPVNGGDTCTRATLHEAFRRAGFNVRELLIELTQTDAFLYLQAPE